jgi:heme-degrading monooxygenase HmoA
MSVLEISRVQGKPQAGDLLADRLEAAAEHLLADPACRSVRVLRCVEDADHFVQLIEWTSVEAHLAWRSGPLREAFRAEIVELLERPNDNAHYETLFERDSRNAAP